MKICTLLLLFASLQACASVNFEPHEDFFTGEAQTFPPHEGKVIVFARMPSFTIRYDKVGTFTAEADNKNHTTASLLALIKHHAAQKGANAIVVSYEFMEKDNIRSSIDELLKSRLKNNPHHITAEAIRINGSIRGLVEKFKDDVLSVFE